MDQLLESLVEVERVLAEAGIESALIGALAVAAWGEPRVTADIDLKVLLRRAEADRLAHAIQHGYDAMGMPPIETLRKFGMLFVRDRAGSRIDFLLAEIDFDVEAIGRAVEMEVAPGIKARVCTAEDLIIYKMLSTRPRDQSDVEDVVRRQRGKLDNDYIVSWLQRFELMLDDSTLVSSFRALLR